MRLTSEQLCDLVEETVRQMSPNGLVERRRIIDAVEKVVRTKGAWEASDDADSESVDPKSIGRAKIDYTISQLKREGRLDNPARNRWRIPINSTSSGS